MEKKKEIVCLVFQVRMHVYKYYFISFFMWRVHIFFSFSLT